MRVEGVGEVAGVVRGGVDGLLQVHAEMHHVQEELERPLVLAVAAGRAEGDVWEAGLLGESYGGRECGAGTLAGLQLLGVILVEVEHLPPRAQRETQALDHRGRLNPRAAGGG